MRKFKLYLKASYSLKFIPIRLAINFACLMIILLGDVLATAPDQQCDNPFFCRVWSGSSLSRSYGNSVGKDAVVEWNDGIYVPQLEGGNRMSYRGKLYPAVYNGCTLNTGGAKKARDDEIESLFFPGHFIWGPYISLNAGDYILAINYDCTNCDHAKFDIHSNTQPNELGLESITSRSYRAAGYTINLGGWCRGCKQTDLSGGSYGDWNLQALVHCSVRTNVSDVEFRIRLNKATDYPDGRSTGGSRERPLYAGNFTLHSMVLLKTDHRGEAALPEPFKARILSGNLSQYLEHLVQVKIQKQRAEEEEEAKRQAAVEPVERALGIAQEEIAALRREMAALIAQSTAQQAGSAQPSAQIDALTNRLEEFMRQMRSTSPRPTRRPAE